VSIKNSVPRRDFLKVTGVLTGLLASSSPIALLAPSRAWAVDLRALSTAEGTTLMAVTRTIAPHDTLEDAAYALVVRAMDGDGAADASVLATLRAGVKQLGAQFVTATEAARVRALTAMESSAFFQLVRAKTLGTLYASPLAYAHFGYEGEAFSKGGYLLRGFQDLRWLPDVPLQDSGPIFPDAAK
jgi:hypothetical protein